MLPLSRIARIAAASATLAALGGCLGPGTNATSGATNTAAASVALTIPAGQAITANSDVSNPANSRLLPQALRAWGGNPSAAYTWQFTSQAPPFQGVSLGAETGTVTGTLPQNLAPGTYYFYFTVTDSVNAAVSGSFTVNVIACDSSGNLNAAHPPCLTLALAAGGGTALPTSINTVVGQAQIPTQGSFGYVLPATGGTPPYSNWTWTPVTPTNTLPPGLALDPVHGVLWGTPLSTAAGTLYSFDITVTDSTGATSAPSRYTIQF